MKTWRKQIRVFFGITLILISVSFAEESKRSAVEKVTPGATPSSSPSSISETKTEAKSSSYRKDALKVGLVDEAAIEDIMKARQEIENKKKELTVREAELKMKEQALVEELKKLTEIRDTISKTEEVKKAEHEEKVAKLVETLISMSPKSASKLVGSLNEGLAVTALSRMDSDRLAKILNLMDPLQSSRLSELMTGLNTPKRKLIQTHKAISIASKKGGEKYDGNHGTDENGLDRKSASEKTVSAK